MMMLLRLAIVIAVSAQLWAGGDSVRPEAARARQVGETRSPQALLEQGRYENAEAAARVEMERLTAAGADRLDIAGATDTLVKALTLNGKGSLPSTIALAERALSIKESLASPTSVDIGASLTNLGTSLGEAAVHPRAIALLQRAASLRHTTSEHQPLLAETLDALGVEFVRAGRLPESVDPLRRSLAIREADSSNATGLTTTLNALVLAFQRKGDYAEARVMLDRALNVSVDRLHPVRVTTLTLLGQQLWFEGAWRESRNASAEAVALAERVLRSDHPDTALATRYLAATMLDLGDIVEAKRLHERALTMAERSLGPQHHEISAYLNGLGESTRLGGAYGAARVLYEKALAIAEPRLGGAHMWVAGLLHNLALVDAHLGDYIGAQRRQARAISIWERALGRDHPIVAVALMELAAAHRERGSPLEAIGNLERALTIRERSLGPNHREVARTLADLATLLMETRRPERALTLATRALAILERVDAQDTPDLATVLGLYAQLQAGRGDHAGARKYLERALAIKQRVFGEDHPSFAETQARLAIELARLGASNDALKAASTAEITGREHLRLMLRYLPERQALNYAVMRPGGLDVILSLVASDPDATAIGLDSLIRSRALVLDEMAKRRNAVHAPAGDTGPLAADLARARQRLVNVVVRGPGTLAPNRYTAVVDEARRDSERAEQLLAQRSAAFRAELDAANVGLDDVRSALPANSALICFVRYRRTAGTSPVAGPSYLAFVVRAGQAPLAIPLGTAASIDALVAAWRSDVVADAAPESSQRTRLSGARLRRAVWDPVAGALKGTSAVFIVPDGTLSLVPFAALPVEQTRYVIDEAPVLHYVSAERDLAVTRNTDQAVSAPGGLLALGGPSFDDGGQDARSAPRRGAMPTNCENLHGITFERLDGSLREVQEIARLWNTPAERMARVLVGREANERAFKNEASRYRVLHLATHGFFLGDACEPPRAGARRTRGVGGLTTASSTMVDAVGRENPLLLSGLALAGANRRASASADEDDGILTAEEVASLNLSGVEWAVLSACGTGLGAIKAGEGVFGLRRAFQVAGARTVIMSLWSVDDEATREWMVALYEGRFRKHLSTAAAVHTATIAMLRDRRTKGLSTAPFYWAAFVAAGDWR
jgi:CHAT domain-containing protein/tetratricopeptide (TPR) repeat protein